MLCEEEASTLCAEEPDACDEALEACDVMYDACMGTSASQLEECDVAYAECLSGVDGECEQDPENCGGPVTVCDDALMECYEQTNVQG